MEICYLSTLIDKQEEIIEAAEWKII